MNVAVKVNNEMTFLYWNIGKDITENVLNNQKAESGKSVIKKIKSNIGYRIWERIWRKKHI